MRRANAPPLSLRLASLTRVDGSPVHSTERRSSRRRPNGSKSYSGEPVSAFFGATDVVQSSESGTRSDRGHTSGLSSALHLCQWAASRREASAHPASPPSVPGAADDHVSIRDTYEVTGASADGVLLSRTKGSSEICGLGAPSIIVTASAKRDQTVLRCGWLAGQWTPMSRSPVIKSVCSCRRGPVRNVSPRS